MNEPNHRERERARSELRRRGYRITRRSGSAALNRIAHDDLTFELWVHEEPQVPHVYFTYHDHGWDLFIQATTSHGTATTITATWEALDRAMPRKPVDPADLDCEIWIGAYVGTPGQPESGDKWIPSQYMHTNSTGQRYVSPRGDGSPLYVAESAFRWTRKPEPKEVKS